jgi:hypothetical protein
VRPCYALNERALSKRWLHTLSKEDVCSYDKSTIYLRLKLVSLANIALSTSFIEIVGLTNSKLNGKLLGGVLAAVSCISSSVFCS